MVIVRLLSHVHDSVLHGKIVLYAIECFMEIKVWPIKHSVRLCSPLIRPHKSLYIAIVYNDLQMTCVELCI